MNSIHHEEARQLYTRFLRGFCIQGSFKTSDSFAANSLGSLDVQQMFEKVALILILFRLNLELKKLEHNMDQFL